jgi:uncharacterized repeat protein (TIGR03803 family)
MAHGLVTAIAVCICMAGVLAIPAISQSAAYSILHNFGATDDGTKPYYGGPALSGSTLYGMTQGGGGSGSYGTLYQINTDGTGYQILHHFTSGTDGTTPRSSLTLSDSIIYGCTEYGGGSNGGTIFQINTNGGGYQVLKRFILATGPCCPYGPPVVSGSTLYGMVSSSDLYGGIYAMGADGGNFTLMHEFAGKPNDGATPYGSLTLVGSRLYGMTYYGGQYGNSGSGYGVVFAIDTNGNNYQILHHFAGGTTDGRFPNGSLTLVGSKLYGMTNSGGPGGGGVVFSMNLYGGDYQVILDINSHGYATGGPLGSLTLWGGKLYGTTSQGGPGGASGTIFRVNPDGTGYQILHGFKTSQGDGGQPMGDLTVAGSRLYGWTYANGTYNQGVFFSCQIPQSGPAIDLLLLSD